MKQPSIAQSSAVLATLAVATPVSGFGLELVLSWTFGGSGVVDAYRTAFLLVSFGNQLFVAFLLPHLLIPVLTSFRRDNREQEGWRLAITCGQTVSSLGLALLLWVWIAPESIVAVLAPGLDRIHLADTVLLLKAFSLALVATLWCGVISGILQVYRIFSVPSIAQVCSNLTVAAAIVALGRSSGAKGIATGVVLGFGLMLFLHARALVRIAKSTGFPLRSVLSPGRFSDVTSIFRKGVPLLLIVAASIVSFIIVNRELSRLPTGTLAAYGYATKLLILVGVAPGALATVVFPSLAEAHGRDSFARLAATSIRMTLFLTAPVAVVLYQLRAPLIGELFGRGAMDAATLHAVTNFYGLLLIQTVPGALNALSLKIAIAHNDTRTAALFTICTTLALALFLAPSGARFGAAGAISAYVAIQTLMPLALLMHQIVKFHVIPAPELAGFTGRLAGLCASLAATLSAFHHLLPMPPLAELALTSILALAILVFGSRFLNIDESSRIEHYAITSAMRLAAWSQLYRSAA